MTADPRLVTRRRLLVGGGGVAVLAAGAAVGWVVTPRRYKIRLGLGPDPYVPDSPQGEVRLETVTSRARGQDVGLFTAVPAGHGIGAGLPVVVVLHGRSAEVADYEPFGLGRFVTAAVERGAPPFVLAGADGGENYWEPDGSDDPRAMVLDELPAWLAQRGFDADRRVLWGWSMGGYGALRIAELEPGWAAGVAAFSPAVSVGDAVFDGVDALEPTPLAVWCGDDDPFRPAVDEFLDVLPQPPELLSLGAGEHSRVYWNDHTLDAFDWLAAQL